MSATAEHKCLELQVSGDSGFCEPCHKYWSGCTEYTSVTRVIRELMPEAYAGVSPDVLENARERGVATEGYFWRWLQGEDGLVVPDDERKDVSDRFFALCEWWAKNMPADTEILRVQPVLFDHEARIAGMGDLIVSVHGAATLVDLKCVAALKPEYAVQLGAYASMAPVAVEAVAILHSTATKVKLVNYDLAECLDGWADARRWWMRRSLLCSK